MVDRGRISTHEPVSQLRKVAIVDCGEPLIPFLELSPRLFWGETLWQYQRQQLLRKSVAEKLAKAADSLPKGYGFSIIEGWRSPHIQKRMHLAGYARWKERHPDWSHSALLRVTNRFTAPLHTKVPPPHSTGGAVDLWLCDAKGEPLDHYSPFERRDRRCYPWNAKGLSVEARKHREIMREAMESLGITNYPSEYWHYSYGDQGWAYRGGHEHAIYGSIVPPGFVPDPKEAIDEPLVWVSK